ncbi:histidine kinase [Flavobacterium cyanobacteriorum]|uniref:Histidine kinase n=1 Tax=Flavobacterium cyanobacteriorum TaxID=2022802 RepID=A0A255ZSG7_9FLAO|nr:2TM domain-containing protein [Flavobacterium cyanobacteriorum]OYQ43864.1 histidine kinase [Flavobacterium cyanobacteriorum]
MSVLRELLRASGLGIILFVVLFFLSLAQGRTPQWDNALLVNFLYVMLYTVTLHMANAAVFIAMDRLFGKNRLSAKRLLAGFLSSFIISAFIVFLLRIFEDVVVEGESFSAFLAEEKASNYYVALIITLIITLAVHALNFYRKYQENRVKEQKLIAGTASAKFESLKNQIDPHFLFNSLNVLSSLIEENPDSAQKFTTSLSKVYRYVLEQKDKELVSVQEELSFAKTYMNLLKMRFENSLFFEMPPSVSNPEALVVPLSLQLLLENTIKHNVASQQRPLHIRIYEEEGCLVVQNDYRKKEVMQDRRGVGLQNIVSRYAILTNRKVVVEQTNDYFNVKLPLLTKQVETMDAIDIDKEEDSYYKAQRKVEEIKDFYGHLFSYIIVNAGLMILNLATYPEYLWFIWPAAGWGLGVAIHAVSVFGLIPFIGAEWEEKKIREILEKEKTARWQ